MTDYSFASATQLAAAIANGETSAEAILDHYLDRISRYNTELNAVVGLDEARARARAHAADKALANGERWGPLHGVPMTVKEAFDLKGLASTWGFEAQADHRADDDAVAVKRLSAAGAVVFGKTNVPVSLADWQTFNPVYGTTNNPWDHTRVPGGSSGGSAAALAAGLTGLEIGSDIGASIRNPAHFCGVYGHKPTFTVATDEGHRPAAFPATPATDIAVIGPLARSASDLEIALDAIVGLDDIDAVGLTVNLPRAHKQSLSEFRVGIVYSDDEAPVDDAVQNQLRALAAFLREAGVEVLEEARPAIDSAQAHDTYLTLLRAATSPGAPPELLNRITTTEVDPRDRSYLAHMYRGIALSHREWCFVNETRHQMRRAWAQYFDDVDLFLCPVATTVAFEHNQVGERWERMLDVNGTAQPTTTPLFWAGYGGFAYLPATVAPVGLSPGGLPVGVQIMGPQYRDHLCIRFARLIETHYQGFQAPPGYV